MKKTVISLICAIIPCLSFCQGISVRDLMNKWVSVVDQTAPEYHDTWMKMLRLSDKHGDSDYLMSMLQLGEEADSYAILDSLDNVLKCGNTSCVDSLREVIVPVSQAMSKMALSLVPSLQGIDIDGNVEDLARQFEKKGWKDYWLTKFTEAELAQAGYTLQQLHRNNGGMIILEGYFRRKQSQLILWPISVEDNNVTNVALTMEYSETNLRSFEEYDLMPFVKEYEKKYGEYSITADSGRYEKADSYTSSYSFSPQEILFYVHFEIPSVSMRVQVSDSHRFKLIVYYLNGYNYFQSENLNNDEI